MAEIQTFIDATVASGGAGTELDPYGSASEWESNEQTDLVSDGDTHKALATGGIDGTAFTISGWGTDSTHFVELTSQASDDPSGVFDSAKYFLDRGTGLGAIVAINDDNTKLTSIQFRRDGPGAVGSQRPCVSIAAQAAGNTHDITSCVFLSIAAVASAQKVGIVTSDSDTVLTANNNVFYDFDDTNDDGIDIQSQTAGSAKVINNTFQNCTVALAGLSSTKVLNNIFQSCGTDVSGTVDTGNSGYNLSDAASGLPGSNNVHSSTLTFKDAANDDFHLDSGDGDAIGAGIGPSSDSDVLTTDVDGDARSGTTCDIGFDEFVAVGGGLIIPIAAYHRRQFNRG